MPNTESALPCDERSPAASRLLFDAYDALIADDLPTARELLAECDGYADVRSLLEALDQVNESGEGTDGALARLAERLSAKPLHQWVATPIPDRPEGTAFVHFESFKRVEALPSGLEITVAEGERSQLRFDLPADQRGSTWAHILLSADFAGANEVFVACRWLHGADPEEVVLRFRHSAIVFFQSVAFPLNPAKRFRLLSIGRFAGLDVAFLDGIPVYWGRARGGQPSGVTLDVIGSGQTPVRLSMPLYMVAKHSPTGYLAEPDASEWFHSQITAAAERGDLDGLSQWLHAASGIEKPLPQDDFRAALSVNTATPLGYRDYITDGLLALLNEDDRSAALSTLDALEPSPLLSAEDVRVEIAPKSASGTKLRGLIRPVTKLVLLDGVNLRAYSGDIVGILGKNGAGKSTFLRTLVAAMPLAAGRICSDGKPMLLRPGAGMLGELTGRENVLKTGLHMGYLPRELEALMDEIIDFAELREHIDRPFKYYSDGMRARLVFALATAIPKEILLFDELLGAGDMGFQRKAMKRLDKFIEQAKLVFVVQHSFDFVLSRCTKCLVLEKGRPVYVGDPRIATELYRESL